MSDTIATFPPSAPASPVEHTVEGVKLVDIKTVARMCDCSPSTIRRLADSGHMPKPLKVHRLSRWRLRTGDARTGVDDWIDAGCPSVGV
jgi:predicted DNA-binding transcriptional regulator AlpA